MSTLSTVNVVGILLSLSCLLVALTELRLRSDLRGRQLGALAATAAWLSMAMVAYDQHRQVVQFKQWADSSAVHEIALKHSPQWVFQGQDGSRVEYSGQAGMTHFVGEHQWRASKNNRM